MRFSTSAHKRSYDIYTDGIATSYKYFRVYHKMEERIQESCCECYASDSRVTPLLNPEDCLRQHTQYICGTCGRCICIERDPHRGLQRWNFPFQSLEVALLYLRSADYTMKRSCGIYEIRDEKGRLSYKIFASREALEFYLRRNKKKSYTGELHPKS